MKNLFSRRRSRPSSSSHTGNIVQVTRQAVRFRAVDQKQTFLVFDQLPDVVLIYVFEILWQASERKIIKCLSLTSSRLRDIALPFMFRCWTWVPNGRGMLPDRLCRHLHLFHVNILLSGTWKYLSTIPEALSSAFPHMVALRTFRVSASREGMNFTSPSLLDELFKLPCFESLEVFDSSSWFWQQLITSPLTYNNMPLRRLVMSRNVSSGQIRSQRHYYSGSVSSISLLLCTFSTSLQSLELSAEAYYTIERLHQAGPWPVLRHLVLHDCPDMGTSDVCLAQVLADMPELRTLKVRYYKEAQSHLALIVWPKTYAPTKDVFLPHLTTLHLTNLDPEDAILDHIGKTLRQLSILPTPRQTVRGSAHPPLTRVQLEQLLYATCLQNLEDLEMAVNCPLGELFFDSVSSTCENLFSLTLHRPSKDGLVSESPEELGSYLRSFSRLRVLKLDLGALDKPELDPREHSKWAMNYVSRLAPLLPQLTELALASIWKGKAFWKAYDVNDPDGAKVLRRIVLIPDMKVHHSQPLLGPDPNGIAAFPIRIR